MLYFKSSYLMEGKGKGVSPSAEKETLDYSDDPVLKP
jgi:hypothetical protein